MDSKKILFSIFLIVLCFLFAAVGFFNYEKIEAYLYGEVWSYIEPIKDIKGVSISDITGNNSIITVSAKELNIYSKIGAKINTVSSISNTHMLDRDGEYSVIVANDLNTIYLYKNDNQISNFTIDYEIKSVSVNSNGYIAVIFIQNGYKSGVKVFSPSGNEQLTTYLANTNAIDCVISNDNKSLYIAEVDMSGIKIKSNIKIVDLSNVKKSSEKEDNMASCELEKDGLVFDIRESSKGLYISSTNGIYELDGLNVIKKICSYNEENVLYTSINGKYPIVIERNKAGDMLLRIYKDQIIERVLDNVPQGIAVGNKRICLNMGDCIEVINEKGKMISKIDLSNKVVKMLIYRNGKNLAVVFRDKIEIFSIW